MVVHEDCGFMTYGGGFKDPSVDDRFQARPLENRPEANFNNTVLVKKVEAVRWLFFDDFGSV